MKKRRSDNPHVAESADIRDEYRFDYSRSRPNRFASAFAENCVAVVLDPDVAAVFVDSKSVNDFLRSVLESLPAAARPRRARKGSNPPLQRTGSARR